MELDAVHKEKFAEGDVNRKRKPLADEPDEGDPPPWSRRGNSIRTGKRTWSGEDGIKPIAAEAGEVAGVHGGALIRLKRIYNF